MVGNAKPQFVTQNAAEFNDKGTSRPRPIDHNLRAHHYDLGNDKPQYESLNQATYTGVFVPPEQSKTKELASDLRGRLLKPLKNLYIKH
jgi:hypothetical protein